MVLNKGFTQISQKKKALFVNSALTFILLHAVLLEQVLDLDVRIDDLADRNVVVDSFNEVSDVLGNIYLVEPRSAEKLRSPVCEVCTEYAVESAFLVSLVELLKAVCEDGIGSISEYSACLLLLEGISEVEHGLT